MNGLAYGWNVVKACFVARAQELGLFYDRRFDGAAAPPDGSIYALKDDFDSSHTAAPTAQRQSAIGADAATQSNGSPTPISAQASERQRGRSS